MALSSLLHASIVLRTLAHIAKHGCVRYVRQHELLNDVFFTDGPRSPTRTGPLCVAHMHSLSELRQNIR